MNNEPKTSQSYESLPQAVEALCLKVFGAKPLYLCGMWGDTTTQNEEIRVQQRQIKSLCEENQSLREDYETLRSERDTWSQRALEEQRRAAGLAVELDNLKTFIREEVVDEIYGQNKGGPELIAKTRAMVSCQNDKILARPDGAPPRQDG